MMAASEDTGMGRALALGCSRWRLSLKARLLEDLFEKIEKLAVSKENAHDYDEKDRPKEYFLQYNRQCNRQYNR